MDDTQHPSVPQATLPTSAACRHPAGMAHARPSGCFDPGGPDTSERAERPTGQQTTVYALVLSLPHDVVTGLFWSPDDAWEAGERLSRELTVMCSAFRILPVDIHGERPGRDDGRPRQHGMVAAPTVPSVPKMW